MTDFTLDIQNNTAKKKRVLIVDDIRTDLHLISKFIKGFGHETIISESAIKALSLIDESIDLVIVDAIMPEIDGFAFVSAMRKNFEINIPIIMITSLSGREDRIKAIEAGVNDFVSKPVDKVELRVRINSMLRMKAAQDKIKQYQYGLENLVKQKTSDLSITLKKLHAVINSMNDCMLIINKKNQIIEANKAFVELSKLTGLSDIKNYDFFSLLTTKAQSEAFNLLLNSSGKTNETDIEFPQWNNKVFSIIVTHIENNTHVLVMRDITEKVQADEQRAQFLSLLSHELRTPLNGIKGFSALINDEKEFLTRKHCDYFQSIYKCSEQLEIIVTELLNFIQLVNNQEELKDEYIALEPIVEKILSEYNKEMIDRNIKVSTNINGESPYIYCKEKHISEVFSQIINNAIRFSNNNSQIYIILINDSNNIKFICKDNGIGIPQNCIERIFESFYQIENYLTRSKQGLGLGLTITKRIVEMYQGAIDISSMENQGTAITVTLPVH